MSRLMSENEQQVCERILRALLNRPISRFFWDQPDDLTNPGIVHPFSLSWIETRLRRRKFATPADFVKDLRVCFQNGKNGSQPGTIRYAAAQQLLADLDALVQTYQPSAFPSVLPLHFITTDFEKGCGMPEHSVCGICESGRAPISRVVTEAKDDADLSILVRDIKFLSSTDLTAKLAVFVKKLQPEGVIVQDNIAFNIGLMTESTRSAVRKYVSHLLFESASGRIDPFARPFGEKATAVRIQERGLYVKSSDSI